MREVSEDEVVAMAGESDCPVLGKEESDEIGRCLSEAVSSGIRSWNKRQA